jgi:hypothetical protein
MYRIGRAWDLLFGEVSTNRIVGTLMNLPELVCLMRIEGMGIMGILVNAVLALC